MTSRKTADFEKDVFGESRFVERHLEICTHAPVCKFIDGEHRLTDDEGGDDHGNL